MPNRIADARASGTPGHLPPLDGVAMVADYVKTSRSHPSRHLFVRVGDHARRIVERRTDEHQHVPTQMERRIV